MRGEKRIPHIIDLIKKIWLKNSDLRLGQLLINIIGTDDLWHIEDDLWEEAVSDFEKLRYGDKIGKNFNADTVILLQLLRELKINNVRLDAIREVLIDGSKR